MRRVNVIGNSCAGKSTFAARLAAALGVPHVEFDALYWEPGWTEVPREVFRSRVAAATAGDGWVTEGNYGIARDIVWPRVDTVIWLDYPFVLVLWRSLRRTFRRVFRGATCCNGNRESLRRTFSRDSIILWVVKTHVRRRREFRDLLPGLASQGTVVLTLRTPGEAEQCLGNLKRTVTSN
jgi:adenylate kinase family enzyme